MTYRIKYAVIHDAHGVHQSSKGGIAVDDLEAEMGVAMRHAVARLRDEMASGNTEAVIFLQLVSDEPVVTSRGDAQ